MTTPVTKETLYRRLERASARGDLDAIEQDAKAQGYSKGGLLMQAIAEKRRGATPATAKTATKSATRGK